MSRENEALYSYCSKYGPKTVGRILHFVHAYCGLYVSEWCTVNISQGCVDLKDNNIALVTGYDEDGNPTFVFAGPDSEKYKKAQKQKFDAVKAGVTWKSQK